MTTIPRLRAWVQALWEKTGGSWAVLGVLLAVLVIGAATFDRSEWPSVIGDEATYLMQAESLAWDADLTYSLEDYERFFDHWQRKPQGLILQSGDRGERLFYGKPFYYALYLAPFVRVSPTRGPFVANAVLLALACLAAARALRGRLGPQAPLWVAVFAFGSVTFAHTFWAHPDLFLMCLTALALAFAFDAQRGPDDDPEPARAVIARWAAVGLWIAIVGFSRPLYLSLLLPAALAVPRRSWRLGLPALAAGALVVVLGSISIHQVLADSWTSYGAERLAFYRHTGFPEADFPASEWSERIEQWGNSAARPQHVRWQQRLVPSLWGWNAVYFLAGRHVGLLPYFLPAVLCLAGGFPGRRRWGLIVALALTVGAFFWLRPFNFYGGGGAFANRYFLPMYPALWFLAARPIRLRWLVAVIALAAPFLSPSWLHSRAYPLKLEERTYRYVSETAAAVLPFETTLSHLKLAGREDLYAEVFVRLLNNPVEPGHGGRLLLPGGRRGELLLGSLRPVDAIDLQVNRLHGDLPAELAVVSDGRAVETLELTPSKHSFRVELPGLRARHPTWWTWDPVYLYLLDLRFDGVGERPVSFALALPPPG